MASATPEMHWHPRVLWIGLGCERGISRQTIETAIQHVCQNNQLAEAAIAGIATIDFKAKEPGLVEFCRLKNEAHMRNWPLLTFSAETLRSVFVPNPSIVVGKHSGTSSVAEAAAILAVRLQDNSQASALLVAKQIFRLEGQPGAVTIAIARAEREYGDDLVVVGSG
jgi:cobalamin biosynthesis protein CbiG